MAKNTKLAVNSWLATQELAASGPGKIRQLITGSTGLEEYEWEGVTLFSHNTQDIKEIVYQMRFDEVTVKYGEVRRFPDRIAAATG